MKNFLKCCTVICAVITIICALKLIFEVADSSVKKYYTVDKGF